MTPHLRATRYSLAPIAQTGDRYGDFSPYVASLNDHGVVAFQAADARGGSGVYCGSGGAVRTIVECGGPIVAVVSHPDINNAGDCCFYADDPDGGCGVFSTVGGAVGRLDHREWRVGPLGPSMNEDGSVAFRAGVTGGAQGVHVAPRGGRAIKLVDTSATFTAFHGLPVINARGKVLFRAERPGAHGIFLFGPVAAGDDPQCRPVIETGERFSTLGLFPILTDSDIAGFAAVQRDGVSGIFAAQGGMVETILDSNGPFESFRGVLISSSGEVIFCATPRSGSLGIFTGPDPAADCVLAIGSPLLGSTVADFALNPVSINKNGQIALRVRLSDQRQCILRADPVPRTETRGVPIVHP